MKKFITLLVLSTVLISTYAQKSSNKLIVKGILKDTLTNLPLSSANISINNKYYTITDKKGNFTFNNLTLKKLQFKKSFKLKITHLGYKEYNKTYRINSNSKITTLKEIKLVPSNLMLNQINVKEKIVKVIVKGDTIQYNAAGFKTKINGTAKDLVDMLPGMSRNEKGELCAQGEKVQSVLIDGKIFLKDVDETLKSIPSNIIKNVKVYDKTDAIARFTGFGSGYRRKTLNIVTKYDNLKFALGKYTAAGGTEDRYSLETQNSLFLGAHRMKISANKNNINQEIYNERSMGGGGTFNGLNTSTMAQINHNIDYNNLNLQNKYKYLRKQSDIKENKINEYINEDRRIESKTKTNSDFEYHKAFIDGFKYLNKKNKITFNPYISNTKGTYYQDNDELNIFEGDTIFKSKSSNKTFRDKKIFQGEVEWASILSDKFMFYTTLNSKLNDFEEINNINRTTNDVASKTTNKMLTELYKNTAQAKLFYLLTENSGFELGYGYTSDKNKKTKDNTIAEVDYLRNRSWLKYKYNSRKLDFKAGLGYEKFDIDKLSTDKNFSNLFYDLQIAYMSPLQRISFMYKHYSNTPNFDQLNPFNNEVITSSVNIGNLNLKNTIYDSFHLSLFKFRKPNIQLMLDYTIAKDYIGSNSYFAKNDDNINGNKIYKGSRVNTYDNLSGYKMLNVRLSNSNFNMKTGSHMTNTLSYSLIDLPNIYENQKNINKNQTLKYEFSKMIRKSNYNVSLSNSLSYSNSFFNNFRSETYSNNLNLSGYVNFLKKYTFSFSNNYDYSYMPNNDKKNLNINILTASLTTRFFKNSLELTFVANDIFNQKQKQYFKPNNIFNSYTQRNDLNQHFLLSLKYNLQTVKTRKGGMQMMNLNMKSMNSLKDIDDTEF